MRKHIELLRELHSRPEVITIAEQALAQVERQEAESAEDEGVIRVWRRRCMEAEAEVAALQELSVDLEQTRKYLAEVEDDLASERATAARLLAALERYGWHEPSCDCLNDLAVCSCGYDAFAAKEA